MGSPGILRPGEPGYDEARRVWNAMVDRRPALDRPLSETADVVAAVALARRDGLEIGVRCGGHSVAGHAVPEGGLMIDLTPDGRGAGRPGAAAGVGAGRRPARGAGRGHPAVRAGDDGRQRLAHRRRRAHARRRDGLARPPVRAGLRQRAVLRGGHRGRRRRPRLGRRRTPSSSGACAAAAATSAW